MDKREHKCPELFVITGVMAAGKSTVAEHLARQFPESVHLRGDLFRKMIVNGREEMSSTPSNRALEQLDLRYQITANTAREYLQAGFTVVIQDNYIGPKLSYFMDLLESIPVNLVVLSPGIEAIEKRESDRNKKGYTGFTVEEMYHMFIETTPQIGFWLDSTNLTVDETVQTIIDHFTVTA